MAPRQMSAGRGSPSWWVYSYREVGSESSARDYDRLPDSPIPIRVAGKDEDLQARGLGAEDVENAVLADGVGVHQDVVEDQDLRLVGGEFLGDGEAEAEEELLLGALRELLESVGLLPTAADAGDLESLVEEDLAGGVAGEFGEGGAEALLQRGEDGLGCGLLAMLDQVVGDAGAPAPGPGGVAAQERLRLLLLKFGFARIQALTAEDFEGGLGLVALRTAGLEVVGNLLERRRRALVALGEFLEIRRQFGPGRNHAGLGLRKSHLGGRLGAGDAVGVAVGDAFGLRFQGPSPGLLIADLYVRLLRGLARGAFLGPELGELLRVASAESAAVTLSACAASAASKSVRLRACSASVGARDASWASTRRAVVTAAWRRSLIDS